MRIKQLLLALGLTGCLATAEAQVSLVKSFPAYGNKFDGAEALSNGKILFSAQDTNKNHQLWVTDGTNAGTKPLTSYCAGKNYNAVYSPFGNPTSYYGLNRDDTSLVGILTIGCGTGTDLRIFRTDGSNFSVSAKDSKSFSSTPGAHTAWMWMNNSARVGSSVYFFSGSKNIWKYDKTNEDISLVHGAGHVLSYRKC